MVRSRPWLWKLHICPSGERLPHSFLLCVFQTCRTQTVVLVVQCVFFYTFFGERSRANTRACLRTVLIDDVQLNERHPASFPTAFGRKRTKTLPTKTDGPWITFATLRIDDGRAGGRFDFDFPLRSATYSTGWARFCYPFHPPEGLLFLHLYPLVMFPGRLLQLP